MYRRRDNDSQGKGNKARQDCHRHVFFLENLFSDGVPRGLIADPQGNSEDEEAEYRVERSVDEVGEVHFSQADRPPIGDGGPLRF